MAAPCADFLTSRGPANAKVVRMFGLGGADILSGSNGRDVMSGNTGADSLKGNGGNDKLNGGVGNDTVIGGDGDDSLVGGEGENRLIGGAGTDTMAGGSGVDTIVAIDGGTTDIIVQGEGNDFIWRDLVGGATDTADTTGTGDVIHDVDEFDNEGADTTLNGDEIPLPDPLSGDVFERFTDRPLFSDEGPSVFDINQGVLGDCYYLAAIGAAAYSDPDVIRSRVVDFGDGTYGVHLGDNFYRVDNRLVVDKAGDQRTAYVSLGEQGSVWATVMEKAFCHHRMQADSYQSIEGGFSYDVFVEAFQSQDAQQVWFNHDPSDQLTAAQHTAKIIEMMEGGYAPTLGVDFAVVGTGLISAHQYVVLDYNLDVFGMVSTVRVYNPWGIDGMTPTSGDPNDGIITLTMQMLVAGIAGSWEFGTVGPT